MAQQGNLFESSGAPILTLAKAAEFLGVSEASVRNWIKTGYIQYRPGQGIIRQSFDDFCSNIAGKEKLVSRANKSLASSHNQDALSRDILTRLQQGESASELSDIYQNKLSDSYRNKEGIYYTPSAICHEIFSDIPGIRTDALFCDPCCGGGNFIIEAIHHGFLPQNIYGFDTDSVAVEITKKRIFEETGYESKTIFCSDFLETAARSGKSLPNFDAVATNPPWGKKLSKAEKEEYGRILGAGKSVDSSSLFFFACLKCLTPGGFLALLLPEAFFKIAVFQNARQKLLKLDLLSLRDFNKPFKGLLTKAQSFCVRNTGALSDDVSCHVKDGSFARKQKSFCKNPVSIINFEASDEDACVLSRIFSKPYCSLENNAQWGLGIVTGNNKKYCQDKFFEGGMPVYKGTDIHRGSLADPETFIPSNLSLYQQVAPVSLFEAEEKLFYRFICSELIFACDTKQSYCLNSVNMLRLNKDFPVSHEQLAALFNTELYSWIFRKLFNTHKILRSDLEKLPIPIEFLSAGNDFSEKDLLTYFELERLDNGAFRVKE